MTGCFAPIPRPDVGGEAARLAGLAEPLAFRVEGDLLDAPGQTPAGLTLAEAVRLALTGSPEVQEGLARVRVAEADAGQARLLPNPVLDVAFRFRDGGGSPVVEAGIAADLLSLLTQPRRVGAADDRLRAAAGEALATALDVLADVQQRYATAQALDAHVAVLENRGQLLDRALDAARARLRAGEGASLAVATLEGQRVELETDVASRQLERAQERLELARLIGRPSDPADWRLDPWRAPPRPVAGEAAWVERALAARPELQAQRWELTALRAEAALAGLAPLDGATVGASAERDDGWSVGPAVSVPLPLFDFGQAKRARAAAQLSEAGHKLTRLRRQVVLDVRKAHAATAAAEAQVRRVALALLPLQQRRRQQAEAAFRVGETDVTTLLLAEEAVTLAEAKLVDARRDATVALVKLRRAVGGPAVAEAVGLSPATVPATGPSTSPATGTPELPRRSPNEDPRCDVSHNECRLPRSPPIGSARGARRWPCAS